MSAQDLTSAFSKAFLSGMNLLIIILGIIVILFTVFWAWFKLKDAEEGDLIDIGLGTYVKYGAFQVRVTIALIGLFFVLLVGLLS